MTDHSEVEAQALAAARQWFAYWRDHHDTDPLVIALMAPITAAYELDRLAGLQHRHGKRGPKKRDRVTRDFVLMLAVALLVDRFGLPATGEQSACEAVAEAHVLLGRKGVEKIWKRYSRARVPTVPGWSKALFDKFGGSEN